MFAAGDNPRDLLQSPVSRKGPNYKKYMSKPLVSIIIAAHPSQHKWLPECIASVNAQTYGCQNIQGIIVSSKEVIARDADGSRYGYVRDPNYGAAHARNMGIRSSNGTFTICLDSDDKLDSTYVERMVDMIGDETYPYVICRSNMQEFDCRNGVWDLPEYSQKVLVESNIFHCASLFTRQLWLDSGGYDASLPGFEDWNLWISYSRLSPKVFSTSDRLFHYRVGPNQSTTEKVPLEPYLRAAIYLKNLDLYHPNKERHAAAITMMATAPEWVIESFQKMPVISSMDGLFVMAREYNRVFAS